MGDAVGWDGDSFYLKVRALRLISKILTMSFLKAQLEKAKVDSFMTATPIL